MPLLSKKKQRWIKEHNYEEVTSYKRPSKAGFCPNKKGKHDKKNKFGKICNQKGAFGQ